MLHRDRLYAHWLTLKVGSSQEVCFGSNSCSSYPAYQLEAPTCQLIRRVVQVCIPASRAAYFASQNCIQEAVNVASVQNDYGFLAVGLLEVSRTEVLVVS